MDSLRIVEGYPLIQVKPAESLRVAGRRKLSVLSRYGQGDVAGVMSLRLVSI